MNYNIELNIEGGNSVLIQCGSKENYDKISRMLEEQFPDKNWKESME